MTKSAIYLVLTAATLAALSSPALSAGKVPATVGQCVETAIKEKFSRLEGAPDSGSGIQYANDVVGVSYEIVAPIEKARVGDKITLCLVSLPDNCPPGDDRGKVYSALDHRTKGKWELPDAEHMCGGA
ncbi:MAG TPA: hypothetical protein VHA07_04605 [Devosia sp.]|nr:hypothetical protein [Devosia sp.]